MEAKSKEINYLGTFGKIQYNNKRKNETQKNWNEICIFDILSTNTFHSIFVSAHFL